MQGLRSLLWTKIPANKTPNSTLIDEKFWGYFRPQDKILDVGCGSGRVIIDGVKRGFKLTGLDINKNEIKQLRKNIGKSAEVIYGDILNIKLKRESFQGAFLQGILSTLEKNKRNKCLKRVRSFLRKGGCLHVSEFKLSSKFKERYENDFLLTKEYGTLSVRNCNGDEIYRSHNFSEKEIINLIKNSGFKIVSIKNSTFTSYHGNKKPGMMVIAKKII